MNAPCLHLGVGIDTARYAHHVSFLDSQKRTAAKPFHFLESQQGYRKLEDALRKLKHKHPQAHFHIRIDAAGQYAENLLHYLHQLDFPATISVGQPARNKAYRKVHFDKRKADPAESAVCARFAVVEQPQATPYNPPAFAQLRDAVALAEAAAKQQTRLVNQLHNMLARVFPEFAVHVSNLDANWALCLLEAYPIPEKLARAQDKSLAKIPHLKTKVAQTLKAAAQTTTGSSGGEIAELLVRQKVREIRLQQKHAESLETLMETAWNQLPQGPHQRLRSIPGIGLLTASALVAKIVTIERFPTAKALIGYFGVFPEEVDVSGTDRQGNPKTARLQRMSCKGNDLVRRLLYCASQTAVLWNPPVRALFARLQASGKENYSLCVGHCMAKLLRQVFALWKKDEDFDPSWEGELPADKPLSEVENSAAGHKEELTSSQG